MLHLLVDSAHLLVDSANNKKHSIKTLIYQELSVPLQKF